MDCSWSKSGSWVGGLISAASKIATRRVGGQGYEAAYLAPEYRDQFADLRTNPTKRMSLACYIASRDTLVFTEGRALTGMARRTHW